MDMEQIRLRRVAARIPGTLLCQKAKMNRGRLCGLERGNIAPKPEEIERLSKALEGLEKARARVKKVAQKVGLPA